MDLWLIDIYSISFWFIAFGVLIVIACILKLWKDISLIKTIYIGVALVISSALFVAFHFLYSEVFAFPFIISSLDKFDANFALAFLGTITGVVALFGGFLAILRTDETKRTNDIAIKINEIAEDTNKITRQQNHAAQQGSIADRLTRADDGLRKRDQRDKPLIEARLGFLYDLERIAQDSIRDHIQIMDMLCHYIRSNNVSKDEEAETRLPREDIQLALTIIGRREGWTNGKQGLKEETKQKYRLDLQGCDLREAIISRANLRGARFLESNMSHATFDDADLSNTWFEDTILNGTWFGRAKMDRAWAWEGDFSKCRALTQEQLDVMYCGIGVKIPDGLTRPKHWPTDELPFDKFQDGYFEWETAQPDSYLKPPK